MGWGDEVGCTGDGGIRNLAIVKVGTGPRESQVNWDQRDLAGVCSREEIFDMDGGMTQQPGTSGTCPWVGFLQHVLAFQRMVA